MALWKRKRDVVAPDVRVQQALAEGEALVGEKPKMVLKALDHLKGDAYPLMTFGGSYHQRFVQVVAQALGWSGPVPDVRAYPWSTWHGRITLGDIVTLARETIEPVLYLYVPPGRLDRGPVAEIEALEALAEDEQLVMVVVGEMNTFLRCDLLAGLVGLADLETEEILQEIVDAARKAGLRTLSIVG